MLNFLLYFLRVYVCRILKANAIPAAVEEHDNEEQGGQAI